MIMESDIQSPLIPAGSRNSDDLQESCFISPDDITCIELLGQGGLHSCSELADRKVQGALGLYTKDNAVDCKLQVSILYDRSH